MLKTEQDFPFDIRQTNICKGLAVIILLWHHMFRYNPREYTPLFYIGGKPAAYFLGDFGHVCVAVFLILSGYGLYKSWNSLKRKLGGTISFKDQMLFVKNHLLKMMFGFWFVYLIFVPLGFLFGRSPIEIYEHNIFYALLDFLGIADLCNTPLYNTTWWFMGIIILYYLLFPLWMKLCEKSPLLLLSIGLFLNFAFFIPDRGNSRAHILSFLLGIVIASVGGFEAFRKLLIKPLWAVLSTLLMMGGFALFRYDNGQTLILDAFFGFSIILLSYLILSQIPILRKVLEEMGRYSASIFMFHSFLYLYYGVLSDLLYSLKYAPLIFLVMAAASYGLSRLIELLKRLIRYDRLTALCTGKKKKPA